MSDQFCYPNMKLTKEQWLGEIPVSWGALRLKRMFSIKKDIAGEEGHTVLSVTQKGIRPKVMTEKGQFAQDYSKYQLVNQGEFVMNHMDLLTGWVDISEYDGVTSPDYRVFVNVAPEKYDSGYYRYIFQLCYSARIFYGLGQGVAGFGRWRLPADMFLNFVLPVPPIEEQRRIGAYLDDQIPQIDSIIEEAKESIEEYKRWKASTIFEAVTKGLNPDVLMRKSGVPWIGDIPAHWRMSRIKNEFDNLDFLREPISAEKRENKLGLYNYYGASGAIDKIDDYNVDEKVLLIGEDGANLRMRNLPLIYRAEGKIWVNNHAHILRVRSGNNYSFMAYLLEAGDYNDYITGAAQPKLSQANLMRFPICIPPSDEQDEIGKLLDEKCSQMDSMIQEKAALIEDTEMYKRSLIYETVTGKRKVV